MAAAERSLEQVLADVRGELPILRKHKQDALADAPIILGGGNAERVWIMVSLLACTEPVTPISPDIPRTQPQVPTPTTQLLSTFQQLNTDIAAFYQAGGSIAWIGVTYDSASIPTLHIRLNLPEHQDQ